jgi:uncharacterized protein (TIGR02266 family)
MGIFKKIKVGFFSNVADKRKYTRVPISVKVTNLSSGNFSYYHATNISIGGIFLKSSEPLPLKTKIHIKFSLPEAKALELKGKVVRVQKYEKNQEFSVGMGIKFTHVSDEVKKSIEEFIDMKT